MDSLSQLVLGAAVGEAVLGKKIGNKALIWGAIAGTIPDLDVLTRPFLDIVEEVEFHRSISHSILLFVFLAPLMGYFVHRWSKNNSTTTVKEWNLLFFLGFLTHALLDCFTTWGTQLFWPSETRIAWKTIFVVDPIYTLPYVFILVRLAFLKRDNPKRNKLNWIGIIITTTYLGVTVINKQVINSKFESFVKEDKLDVLHIDSRPMPLQNILWTANIETPESFYIYYYSHLDNKRQKPYSVSKNHHLLTPYLTDPRVQKLIKISEGFYTISIHSDKGIYFNDLRFGQTESKQGSKFLFSYHVYHNEGRVNIDEVEKDMSQAAKLLPVLWKRILGEFEP